MRNRILFALSLAVALAIPVAAQSHYDLDFTGVTYNANGTSTWSYSLTWDGTPPGLSHLTIALCNSAALSGATTPPGAAIGQDGNANSSSTNLYGIKWDFNPGLVANVPFTYSFTLSQWHAVGMVPYGAKAGQDLNLGTIEGPSLDCLIADPELTVAKSCSGPVFVGDEVHHVVTVTNSGNVTLSNVSVTDEVGGLLGTIPTLAPGASQQYDVYLTTSAAGVVGGTASATGSYYGNNFSDSDACSTSVYALGVVKTASTSFSRDHDWSIAKSADTRDLELAHGQSATIGYTLDVTQTGYTDSDWSVSGTITVSNPAPIDAVLTSVFDALSDGGIATVDCGVSFPYTLTSGSSLSCSYAAALTSAATRTNTGTAWRANNTGGTSAVSGTALVDFASASITHVDESVSISDVPTCPEGFLCTSNDSGAWSVNSSGPITYEVTVVNDSALCDTEYFVDNVATLTEVTPGEAAHAGAVQVRIYTGACDVGCTLTIGYWKTHAGFTGNNADRMTVHLPQSLGAGGGTTLVVSTAQMGVDVLTLKTYGAPANGITKLYAQMLAAKLNIANGASSGAISAELASADTFLAQKDWTSWVSLSKSQQKTVLMWMSTFDFYNNGEIGPGHCD